MKRLTHWLRRAPHQPPSDYGDRILRVVLTTRLVEGKVHHVVLMILTILLRFVISLVVKSCLYFNSTILTFLTTVAFSVSLVMVSDTLYNMLSRYRKELAPLTHHICRHWDDAHLKVWKRNTMLVLSALIILYAAFVDITSAKVIQWTLEYVLCYFIVEGIQHRTEWADRIHSWLYRPKVRQFAPMPDVLLDESYHPNLDRTLPPPEPPQRVNATLKPKKQQQPNTKEPTLPEESVLLTQSMPPWLRQPVRKTLNVTIIDDYFGTH